MVITIETPTAEAAFEALQQLPESEMARLKMMFRESREETVEEEETAWHQASARAAERFEEEGDAQ